MVVPTARQIEPGEVPAHGAVLERDDPVGNAGVDERLRADDRARAAGAVDHDQRVGRGHHVVDPVDELRAGAVGGAGDAHPAVLGERAAVEDDDFLARRDATLHFLRLHARRVLGVLDQLAERLGGHVDAAVDLIAGGFPGRGAALEQRHVGVAMGEQPPRGHFGQAFVTVDHDHAGGASRHQQRDPHLEPRQGRAGGEQQMALGEDAFLAHVEQRDLAAVVEAALQLLRGEGGDDHGVLGAWISGKAEGCRSP
jgi:hypothetical protein